MIAFPFIAGLLFLLAGASSLHAVNFNKDLDLPDAGGGINAGNVAWGDYNNDGNLDLVVTGWVDAPSDDNRFIIYRNNGDGTFTTVEEPLGDGTGLGNSSVAWGDFDGDGDLDLAVSGDDGTNYRLIVYENQGGGNFSNFAEPMGADQGLTYSSVEWVDYDNDGDLDLAVSGDDGNNSRLIVYENDGTGNFSNKVQPMGSNSGVSSASSSFMAWGDYTNDGYPDLAVSGWDGSSRRLIVFENEGDGNFTNIDEPMGSDGVTSSSLAWGDYDKDGDLELAVSGYDGNNTRLIVYEYDGIGNFAIGTEPMGANSGVSLSSLAWADYDNDGDLDLAVSGNGQGNNRLIVYENDGTGNFPSKVEPMGSNNGLEWSSIAWGDYDNDGDLDLALSGVYGYEDLRLSVYESDVDGDTPNNRPPTPSLVTTDGTEIDYGDTINLEWNSVTTDDYTPQELMTYNLRIGTSPGSADVMPADVSDNEIGGKLFGNTQLGDTHFLKSDTVFKPGTYHWAVQAVDGGKMQSSWSSKRKFMIPNDTPVINPPIPDQSAKEDADSWTIGLTDRASDTNEEAMKWTIADGADTLVNTSLSNNAYKDGGEDTLTLTPVTDANGTSSITLRLGDGQDSTTQTFTVTLTPEGAGTSSNPFRVEDWTDLDWMHTYPDSNFNLVNNVDKNSRGYDTYASATANSGNGWDPIDSFTGNFDGNGHEIHDLVIDRGSTDDVGLFGGGFDAEIRNLGMVDPDIIGDVNGGSLVGVMTGGTIKNSYAKSPTLMDFQTNKSASGVGGLVGRMGSGTTKNSYVKSPTLKNIVNYTGGLVGMQAGGTIKSSYTKWATLTGNGYTVGGLVGNGAKIVNSYALSPTITGNEGNIGGLVGRFVGNVVESSYVQSPTITNNNDKYVGGLIGASYSGSVVSSYVRGDTPVDGGTSNSIGGLVGRTGGTIEDAYAAIPVQSTGDNVGGLVGVGSINNSYYDTFLVDSAQTDNSKGTPAQTVSLARESTFTDAGWDDGDFGDTWTIDENRSYPFFQYQSSDTPFADTYSLRTEVNEGGPGTVDSSLEADTYLAGETVSLSADTTGSNSTFLHWTVNPDSGSLSDTTANPAEYQFADTDVTVTAHFSPFIEGTIPDQVDEEDADSWTIGLEQYAADTITDPLKWEISDGADTLVDATLTNNTYKADGTDTLSLTPVVNANGTSPITLALGDGEDTATETFKIILTPVSHAIDSGLVEITPTNPGGNAHDTNVSPITVSGEVPSETVDVGDSVLVSVNGIDSKAVAVQSDSTWAVPDVSLEGMDDVINYQLHFEDTGTDVVYSDSSNVNYDPYTADPPTNLTVSDTYVPAMVSWDRFSTDPDTGTGFESYQIFYDSGTTGPDTSSPSVTVSDRNRDTVALKRLEPNTNYGFRIAYNDQIGNRSVLSDVTSDTVKVEPPQVEMTDVTSTVPDTPLVANGSGTIGVTATFENIGGTGSVTVDTGNLVLRSADGSTITDLNPRLAGETTPVVGEGETTPVNWSFIRPRTDQVAAWGDLSFEVDQGQITVRSYDGTNSGEPARTVDNPSRKARFAPMMGAASADGVDTASGSYPDISMEAGEVNGQSVFDTASLHAGDTLVALFQRGDTSTFDTPTLSPGYEISTLEQFRERVTSADSEFFGKNTEKVDSGLINISLWKNPVGPPENYMGDSPTLRENSTVTVDNVNYSDEVSRIQVAKLLPGSNRWHVVDEVPKISGSSGNYSVTFNVLADESIPGAGFSVFRIVSAGVATTGEAGDVVVYPNPFKPHDGNPKTGEYGKGQDQGIYFGAGINTGFPAGTKLTIYNIMGERIDTVRTTTGGLIQWDARTRSGKDIASGVYLFHLDVPDGGTKTGKFTVIR